MIIGKDNNILKNKIGSPSMQVTTQNKTEGKNKKKSI